MKNNTHVGIWHETYKVRAGEYECIYNNMPRFGLAKVGEMFPATGKREYSGQRISQQHSAGKDTFNNITDL